MPELSRHRDRTRRQSLGRGVFAGGVAELRLRARHEFGRLEVQRQSHAVQRTERHVAFLVEVPRQGAAIKLTEPGYLIHGQPLSLALVGDEPHHHPGKGNAMLMHANDSRRLESSIVFRILGLYHPRMQTEPGAYGEIPRTQARSQRTHQLLLEAAAEEFAKAGYENAPIATIARRAGLTTGAFYAHFPSKWAIAEQLVQDQLREVQALRDHVGEQLATAFERLLCFSADLSELITQDARARGCLQLSIEPSLPMDAPVWHAWGSLADQLVATASDVDTLRESRELGALVVILIVGAWLVTRDEGEAALDGVLRPMWSALAAGVVKPERGAAALESVATIFGA